MLAVQSGSKAMVDYMLEKGASLDKEDEFGRSALNIAILSNFSKIVKSLVDFGASLTDMEQEDLAERWFLAAEEGNAKTVDAMLLSKFNPNRINDNGASALILAAKSQRKPVYTLLLANKSTDCDITDLQGNLALHYAAQTGNFKLVKDLCSRTRLLSTKNFQEQTAHDIATSINHTEMEAYILDKMKKAAENSTKKQ
eukprot:UN30467